MELADVQDSKSCGSNTVWVRPPPPAPRIPNEGFFFYAQNKICYNFEDDEYEEGEDEEGEEGEEGEEEDDEGEDEEEEN